jgi:hypothetical protein
MSRLSTTGANAAIAATLVPSTTYYLALFTSDPSTTGATGEVTGGSYARQGITFGTASGGTEASTNAQNFTSMPLEAAGIPYFGVFTSSTGGTYICGGTTSGLSGSIPAGANVNFAIGSVTVSFS